MYSLEYSQWSTKGVRSLLELVFTELPRLSGSELKISKLVVAGGDEHPVKLSKLNDKTDSKLRIWFILAQ